MSEQDYDQTAFPIVLMLLLCAVTLFSGLNLPLSLALNQSLQHLPDGFWANLTILGDSLVCLALINFGAKRYPQLLAAALLGGLLATLLTRSMKALFAVDRPLVVLNEQIHTIGIDLHNFSFPSGHTTAIFLTVGLYALACKHERITALLFSFALLVGLSRVAVGAHWLADVLAGAVFGWLCAAAGWKLAKGWQWSQTTQGHGALGLLFAIFALLTFAVDTGYPQGLYLQLLIATLSSLVAFTNLWRQWQIIRHRNSP